MPPGLPLLWASLWRSLSSCSPFQLPAHLHVSVKEHRAPKAEIRLQNAGIFGPMFVHTLLLKDKEGNALRPADAFCPGSGDRFVAYGADDVFGDYGTSPVLWHKHLPLITVGPRGAEDDADAAYAMDFYSKIHADGNYIEVTTSSSDRGLLGFWKTTRKVSLRCVSCNVMVNVHAQTPPASPAQ